MSLGCAHRRVFHLVYPGFLSLRSSIESSNHEGNGTAISQKHFSMLAVQQLMGSGHNVTVITYRIVVIAAPKIVCLWKCIEKWPNMLRLLSLRVGLSISVRKTSSVNGTLHSKWVIAEFQPCSMGCGGQHHGPPGNEGPQHLAVSVGVSAETEPVSPHSPPDPSNSNIRLAEIS